MNEQIQKLLNNLIHLEYVSSTLYLAMSNYINRLNYKGMGSWLRLQSEEERTHMLKLIDDPQTLVIVQDFLREQVDEEAQTIVDRLKIVQNNPAAIFILDQELGQRKAAPAGGAAAQG